MKIPYKPNCCGKLWSVTITYTDMFSCVWSYRYESAFSLKPEDRYTAGLGRKSSWDDTTENTVEDISTSYSDTSGDK